MKDRDLNNDSSLSQQIADQAARNADWVVVRPPAIGQETWRNELLLFVKPEVFVADGNGSQKILDLVLGSLERFGARVSGIVVVSGKLLGQQRIMERHYGLIGRFSREASSLLSQDDRVKIAEMLGLPRLEDGEILGGHEYLSEYAEEDISDLTHLWFSKKAIRFGNGVYLQTYEKRGRRIILVNGFYPAQLAHLTNPSHKIVFILIHSNACWATLRHQMLGETFPEEACPESIRGMLYRCPSEYGLKEVTVAQNGVHLSAGPFEAAMEIANCFGAFPRFGLEGKTPLVLSRMLQSDFLENELADVLENPNFTMSGQSLDLFSATKDMDTENAIALWKSLKHMVTGAQSAFMREVKTV